MVTLVVSHTTSSEKVVEYKIEVKMETISWMRKTFLDQPGAKIQFEHPDFSLNFYRNDRLPSQFALSYDESENERFKMMEYTFPKGALSDDIVNIVNMTFVEVVKSYQQNCFLAAISLCGKIIETVLWEAYEKEYGERPDSKNLGLNAILNNLNKKGYFLNKDAVKNQMELIGLHRNKAAHGNVILPTQDEARGVIYLTKDVLQKITATGS